MMSRNFTRREKILLLVLCVLLLAILYYQFIYKASQETVEKYSTDDLQVDLQLEETKAGKIDMMKREIESNSKNDLGVVSSYNNIKNELAALNDIFKGVSDYNLEFGQPTVDGEAVRRPVNITFNSASYSSATTMVRKIHDCKYRCLIRSVSIDGSESESGVSVSMEVTFFETMLNANSNDGLEAAKNEKSNTESQSADGQTGGTAEQ